MVEQLSKLLSDRTYEASPMVVIPLMIATYFVIIRVVLRAYVIQPRKMTKKERKAHDKTVRNRTKKEQLIAVVNWFLCKGYSEEQKGWFYPFFAVLNYVYLLLGVVYVLLTIIIAFYPSLETVQGLLEVLINSFVHVPLAITIFVFAVYERFKS